MIAFFLAPFAGLLIGILQLILRRDDVLPYVPYLCAGVATVIVLWAPIWSWAQSMFAVGPLVPAVLGFCVLLLGFLLSFWRIAKSVVFGLDT